MKTYELPMTRDYVSHWDLKKAVQELLQNAIDSTAPFEHEFYDGGWATCLSVNSRGVELPVSSLLLGSTSKASDDSKIGSFGEGYKIALLVLTRLGHEPVVRNNGKLWATSFVYSQAFEAEVLCITETDDPSFAGKGLSFVVGGLTDEDISAITSTCLQMQNEEAIGKVVTCPQGRILLDRKGELFVNGLYVCKSEFTHSYDVKPSFLRLERDRQTVSAFDLAWVTKEMWFTVTDPTLRRHVAKLIVEDAPDLKYANYGAPNVIKEACLDHFTEVAGKDARLASSPEEVKQLRDAGVANPVYYNTTLHGCVTEAPSYVKPPMAVVKTPSDILQLWYDRNKKYMKRLPAVGFKKLLEDSAYWKVK